MKKSKVLYTIIGVLFAFPILADSPRLKVNPISRDHKFHEDNPESQFVEEVPVETGEDKSKVSKKKISFKDKSIVIRSQKRASKEESTEETTTTESGESQQN